MKTSSILSFPTKRLLMASLLFNVFELFHSQFPHYSVLIVGLLYTVYMLNLLFRYLTFAQSLLLLLITLIPSSFISLLGTSYAAVPVSIFSLIIFLLFLHILIKNRLEPVYLLTFLLFLTYAVLSLIFVEYRGSAIKQIIDIATFLLSFSIGAYFYRNESDELFLKAAKLVYCQTSVIFAATIILQRFYIVSTANVIGTHGLFALGRVSYSGLMTDFSFASLYIATGCIATLYSYTERVIKRFSIFVVSQVILFWSLIYINARTGLFALAVATVAATLKGLVSKNTRQVILSLSASVVIIFSGVAIYNSRGKQSFADGSGRNIAYSSSTEAITTHPYFGIGFGEANYQKTFGNITLPHNFFIQYLVQGGAIGLLIILLNFLLLSRMKISRDNMTFLILISVVAGALLVPDILSSRYLFVIVVMVFIASRIKTLPMHKGRIKSAQ